MKNLKIFVASLIGASFLFGCAPKSMDVEKFMEKVNENYDEGIFSDYINKVLYVTGDKSEQHKVNNIGEDLVGYKVFNYTSSESEEPYALKYIFSDILSIGFINYIEYEMAGIKEQGADTKASYFISNNTYTIETSIKKVIGSATGERFSKYVFNQDFVISHYEERVTATEEPTYELKIDFSYQEA